MANELPHYGISVIENTHEARNEFGHAWGSGEIVLSQEHLRALMDGKCIAYFDGEYVHFITLNTEEDE